jgi:hypothetical protein
MADRPVMLDLRTEDAAATPLKYDSHLVVVRWTREIFMPFTRRERGLILWWTDMLIDAELLTHILSARYVRPDSAAVDSWERIYSATYRSGFVNNNRALNLTGALVIQNTAKVAQAYQLSEKERFDSMGLF